MSMEALPCLGMSLPPPLIVAHKTKCRVWHHPIPGHGGKEGGGREGIQPTEREVDRFLLPSALFRPTDPFSPCGMPAAGRRMSAKNNLLGSSPLAFCKEYWW